MRGNSWGKMLSLTSFGESHGPAMGVVLDGVPSNLDFSLDDLNKELRRRAPGQLAGTTSRRESDEAEILSGIYQGKTLGTPIAVIIRNTNQRSDDYQKLAESQHFRAGHADATTLMKYGLRDHRGGGRSSGRETVARVVAGYFASLILPQLQVKAIAQKIGPIESSLTTGLSYPYLYQYDWQAVKINAYGLPEGEDDSLADSFKKVEEFLLQCKREGRSVGGQVFMVVDGVPPGLGEPAFDKLKADLAKGILSIGACTSFSYGLGEEFADYGGEDVSTDSSYFGGMEGGISNGQRLFMRATFKPTSTVGEKAKEGRHDPCIIPRALPVVESMIKFILADHFLRQRAYQS